MQTEQSFSTGEQLTEETNFKFVFLQHELPLAEQAGEALRDCDIVAIEYPGLNDEVTRQHWEHAFTRYVAADATQSEREEFFNFAMQSHEGQLIESLLRPLSGTGKPIRLIDVTAQDPGYEYLKKTEERMEQREVAADRYVSNDDLAEILKGDIEAAAAEYFIRDLTMAEQLEKLAESYPGKKIGVLAGAVHTAVHHDISRNFNTERVFITYDGSKSAHAKMLFDHENEQIRNLRFRGQMRLNPDLMDRMVLVVNRELFGQGRTLRTEIDTMTIEDVRAELTRYDDVKADRREQLGPDAYVSPYVKRIQDHELEPK